VQTEEIIDLIDRLKHGNYPGMSEEAQEAKAPPIAIADGHTATQPIITVATSIVLILLRKHEQ
jgi:hypothetical protein